MAAGPEQWTGATVLTLKSRRAARVFSRREGDAVRRCMPPRTARMGLFSVSRRT